MRHTEILVDAGNVEGVAEGLATSHTPGVPCLRTTWERGICVVDCFRGIAGDGVRRLPGVRPRHGGGYRSETLVQAAGRQ